MTAVMQRRTNRGLSSARSAKNNEFYTSLSDIESEMSAYVKYNKDAFRNKTVLLPCDDPEWSNFTKYFVLNFEALGLKKLISTSYAPASNPSVTSHVPASQELDAPHYDPVKSWEKGRILVLERDDISPASLDIDDLVWDYLDGDGDFRSEEVTKLRDDVDMVVTNPPFSLFREFVAWMNEGGVQFSVIGNMNAVTYKEIFPLFKDNKVWYGPSISSGDREFRVPDNYPLTAASSRIDEHGNKHVRVKGVRWFTNIEHGRRHEPLELMTVEDNLNFSRRKKIKEQGFPAYSNYAAIEVGFTESIPSDCIGVMGVPISFLDRYSPDQFEILGISEQNVAGGSGDLWDPESGVKQPLIEGKRIYARIFVRHKI